LWYNARKIQYSQGRDMDITTLTLAINSASSLLDALVDFVPKVIATTAVVAAFLPPPDQDNILSKVHRIINLVAFNFKHAANKEND
jgi:hypothetical protein